LDIIVGLSVLGGVVLIAATLFDIVATVLHPQAQSPISNRFHRLGWRLLGGVARRLPAAERRHVLLGWGLPLLISGLIGLWVLALAVGFALLYYPWIGDPAHFDTPPGTTGSPLDAFYFSGTSLTTVGFGDFQALSYPFRLLAIAEAASGFVVISLSVAYLLAVYPAVGRVQSLAAALDAEVAGQPTAGAGRGAAGSDRGPRDAPCALLLAPAPPPPQFPAGVADRAGDHRAVPVRALAR
jgi:hypothetical protein